MVASAQLANLQSWGRLLAAASALSPRRRGLALFTVVLIHGKRYTSLLQYLRRVHLKSEKARAHVDRLEIIADLFCATSVPRWPTGIMVAGTMVAELWWWHYGGYRAYVRFLCDFLSISQSKGSDAINLFGEISRIHKASPLQDNGLGCSNTL